jgi:hypothetical protein
LCKALNARTGLAIPQSICDLEGATPRFTQICEKEDMWAQVQDMLGM